MSNAGIAAVSSSIDAVNQVLQTVTQATMKHDEKQMKVAVELSVGKEVGKGENVDYSA